VPQPLRVENRKKFPKTAKKDLELEMLIVEG